MQHAIICNLCARQRQTAFLRRDSRTQEPAMEGLNRLVSESMARHGFDRPLDYRRLHWSRWFRCESHHSLLFVPSKPGVFALAEEIMHLGDAHVGADAFVRPPKRTEAESLWDRVSDPVKPSEARQAFADSTTNPTPHRMLA